MAISHTSRGGGVSLRAIGGFAAICIFCFSYSWYCSSCFLTEAIPPLGITEQLDNEQQQQQNNKERDTKLPMAFSSILCCSKNSIKIISCRVMCKTVLSETWSPNRFLIFCSSYLSTATPSQQSFTHKISTKVKATIIKSCWLAILNSCLNCYPKIL